MSKMEIELEYIRQKKILDEEEAEERLRAIEKKRQNVIKEMRIQQKMLGRSETASRAGTEVDRNFAESSYKEPDAVGQWVENARKYTFDRDEKTFQERGHLYPSSKQDFPTHSGIAERYDLLQDLVETNKLLVRHKVKDLPSFTGELTEWPIFISQFRRSTDRHNFTDEENLMRLDKALRGKAREAVKALMISPDNVSKIIKMLEMNFRQTEWIILSLMDKVKKFGMVNEDKLDSCISFSNAINNMVITMKNVNSTLYLYNPELLASLVEKLSPIQRRSWGKIKYHRDMQGSPISLEDFSKWFEEEINILAATYNPFQKNRRKESVMLTKNDTETKNENGKCGICRNSDHSIQECGEFVEKSIAERRQVALKLKLCFLCLKFGHMASRCRSKTRCGTDSCRGIHSELLHMPRITTESNRTEHETSPSIKNEYCANLTSDVMLRIAPVIVRGPTKEIETFALFDEGSTCSMIEKDLASELGLCGPISPLCFQWTNGITHFEETSRVISLNISSGDKKRIFYIMKNLRTVSNLCLPEQHIDAQSLSRKFPYLDRELLEAVENVKPMLLIGQDNCGLIVPRHVIQPRLDQPILSQSKLGWTIHGPIADNSIADISHVNLCCHTIHDDELHLMVKNTFKLEDFGVKIPNEIIKSVEDKRALEILENTLRKNGDHYEVGHLWRNFEDIFPESENNAKKRLICMERKMDKNSEFAEQYCQKINEYLKKGYASKLEMSKIEKSPKDWYLPHFAVWNINKPNKIRLVFDAAAKSSGSSLNDFLLQGPSHLSVLWRFRQEKTAVSGDIREMFHQVHINEIDRCAQRFLWRAMERNKEPEVYQMNVMIFGAVSSPSVAQFVKNRNAEYLENEYPGITRAMKKQHYVDDYLDSFASEEQAIRAVADIIDVHKKAGFEMVKWISNSENVMNSIPVDLRAESTNHMKIDSEKVERVLGLAWSPEKDTFLFALNFRKIPQDISSGCKVPTKREVLRTIMSVFDPLGFLAPLMVKARILMQNIWRIKIDWDSEISEDLFLTWQHWLNTLKVSSPIEINRYYFPNIEGSLKAEVEMHIFCDASDKAYSAVVFFRLVMGEKVHTSFVCSKFKVAPLNQQSIPKLELQGAVLASRLAKTVRSEVEYNIKEIHFWTDSLVILRQIRSESRRFPMFVACRVGEIQEDTEISSWHWVPSDQNVSDLATKECKSLNFQEGCEWFLGPSFLKDSKEFWPSEPICLAENEATILLITNEYQLKEFAALPDINRFSKWSRIVRASAWIIHFKNVIRKRKDNRPDTPHLDIAEIEEASILWVKKSQYESFEADIKMLKKEKTLPKFSRLFKLNAFIDNDGVVRLRGRFPDKESLNMDYNYRCPIILDPKHLYTQLLVHHYHEIAGHIGIETVVNNLRLKFWIMKVRSAVKRCFNKCQECRIRKCKPVVPEMAMLPEQRLEPFVFPFTYVGVDFFGPMTISIGRRLEKRYGMLFTCLTIRAIHIELASSLDTSSAIMAIRRFVSRRGQPKEIFSDNGTNFVGADRELRESIKMIENTIISNELSLKGISWRLNPPSAPHMGGIWERMIRSIKTALKISLKSVHPKEEVLATLLAEIECTVNSRPLTHISVDPNEPEALTPNHFLLMRPGSVQNLDLIENEMLSRKQWRVGESLANAYWRRCIKEYRPTLICRSKWYSKTDPIKIGDICVIVDEKSPRNEWLIGRIIEVYPGRDRVIRVANVKTKRGNFTRPLSKLCILPTDGEDRRSSRVGEC